MGVHGNLLFAIVLELLAIMIEFFQTLSTIFQDAMTASSQCTAKQHIRAILISSEVASIDRLARYPAYRLASRNKNLHDSGQMMLLSIRY